MLIGKLPSCLYSRKLIGFVCFLLLSRSPSRERKRPRWEEERERWSESQSANKEKNYTSIKDKESEENASEKNEDEDDELLKPVWVRCTHSESYYSNDPMDQVVCSWELWNYCTLSIFDYLITQFMGTLQQNCVLCHSVLNPPSHLSLQQQKRPYRSVLYFHQFL